MDAQKVRQLAWDTDVLQAFAPAVAVSPWNLSPMDAFHGSQAFEILDGDVRLLMAAKGFERGGVRFMEITGLVSDGARLTTEAAANAINILSYFYTAQVVGVFTPHKHLHRLANRIGFVETGKQFMKRCTHAIQ